MCLSPDKGSGSAWLELGEELVKRLVGVLAYGKCPVWDADVDVVEVWQGGGEANYFRGIVCDLYELVFLLAYINMVKKQGKQ